MKQEVKKKQGLARLFQIAGEKKMLLIVSGLLAAISAACMLVPFVSVYQILGELLRKRGNISLLDSTMMIKWGWIAFAGLVAGLLLLYAAIICSHVAAFRILYGLRMGLAKHISKLSLGYLNSTATGAVKKNLEQDVERIELFVAHTIPDLVNVAATVVVMFIIFFSLNGWMAFTCIIAFIASMAMQASMMFGKKAQGTMKAYFDSQERIHSSAVQYVRGIPVVKVFGQTVFSFKKFHTDLIAYRDWAVAYCDKFENGMAVFTVVLNSFLTFVLPVGLLIMSGNPNNMSFALVYLFFIIMVPGASSPLYKLTLLASGTREIFEGVSRIDKIYAEEPIIETLNPKKPQGHDIVFENVTFAYENKAEATRVEALTNISFTAKAGEITALVGPSGSGKSTVANLIPRFWDVAAGEIKIGGVNIKDISTEELMNTVAFVFQDTFLFYDTLFENIRVGKPDATEEEVYEAAKAAQCHEFIESLPEGYNTLIGEGGVFLSGGEEQRVSVARAILKNAPILVLDEATAFADPENEYKMQVALKELIKDKTVIIIAHRLSSIKTANQIIVLKNGKVEQIGTHDALVDTEGLYQRMWEAYTSAYDWTLKIGGVKA
ncbi:ABC transporter ATP-binding protein [Proteiniborus sp. MB09-C3]|uniref:ABC transporter ATP-binding protein n=1 Tax=Proteiniborus sp. MB09-C3 TaxID=3050072 RepID=UPI0025544682|nr:ABC transporter ATP-binding protein [Proteiniborus sp. MB09-C3]WIV12758.1 ABC transporter ATP-binding protein [Proteiniborus sp. MB09-C3]